MPDLEMTDQIAHRRRSSVNLIGGTTFLPDKYVRKINKMPDFYKILAPQKTAK